jgi:hypothetical protein
MRVCSDCKEQDRKYKPDFLYKCKNDFCEWYVCPIDKIEYVLKPYITILPKTKISDYYFTDYIIKGKQGIFRRFI